jgi:hypothetical protein
MTRLLKVFLVTPAVITLALAQFGGIVHASGGSATGQTVNVYRQACTATASGAAVGTARFAADDQGGNPGGLEIRTGLTAGLPRTSYTVSVLNACQVLATVGTLQTDDSGRGDLDVHVAGSLLPAGATLRVQLIAPTDVLTSDPTSSI